MDNRIKHLKDVFESNPEIGKELMRLNGELIAKLCSGSEYPRLVNLKNKKGDK